MTSPSLSVILSTYNQPDWLEKVLWGYACQKDRAFELVIADDGSEPATRERIEKVRAETGSTIQHVWHPDDGFQKSTILNKAIVAAKGDYLIFSDGDCIPRNDFVTAHRGFASPGRFLSGGYTKLPADLSRQITGEDVESGRVFDSAWLSRSLPTHIWDKHVAKGLWARILNAITPTRPTWNGHNASGWKRDLLRVNGFDERIRYGGQDREMGARLTNLGVRGRQIRHFAIVLHLDHSRSYASDEIRSKNRQIQRPIHRATRLHRLTWTEDGILKQKQPPAELRP